jgi:uncharacterized protein (UPF0332 family)
MNGRDFLILADSLLISGSKAARRSAVSRAYYAGFHVARELLSDLGFTVPRGDQAHGYLWLRLSNCSDQQVELAGREVNQLRRDRNRSDYDIQIIVSQTSAEGQVQRAKSILQILDAATSEPTRSTITDAMKLYERDVLKEMTWHP